MENLGKEELWWKQYVGYSIIIMINIQSQKCLTDGGSSSIWENCLDTGFHMLQIEANISKVILQLPLTDGKISIKSKKKL